MTYRKTEQEWKEQLGEERYKILRQRNRIPAYRNL
jgi:hypothetical protein